MQMGGAIGSLVGQLLRVTDRERRILLVAGTAAGMAAVFRTPLGAALLAVEVLHRDDFEADALVPAVLASVVATRCSSRSSASAPSSRTRRPTRSSPEHLPLYALLAVLVSLVASVFLVDAACRAALDRAGCASPTGASRASAAWRSGSSRRRSSWSSGRTSASRARGSGSSAAGTARRSSRSPAPRGSPSGGAGSSCSRCSGVVKIVATCLTVGTGGSAGDFGPSLVIGGLFGGAFGRAAQLLLHDPRIDPGAFALVGMGTFYGGLAHVPIASLVMTCELAGSYDLLVPLMLAEGIAFVALRNRSLYHAQVATKRDSPGAPRRTSSSTCSTGIRVGDVVVRDRPYATLTTRTPANEVIQKAAANAWQDVFPVLDDDGKLVGMVLSRRPPHDGREPGPRPGSTIAHDMMVPPVSVGRHRRPARRRSRRSSSMACARSSSSTTTGRIVGFLDEAEITRSYQSNTASRPD